jgi:hypothetical protein
MTIRSAGRRTLAALATSALAAGALVVPAVMLAAPAQAATGTVEDVAFSCSSDYGPMSYTSDITFSATWSEAGGRAEISAHVLGTLSTGAPVSGGVDAVLHLKEHSGTTAKTGTLTGSDADGFASGVVTGPEVKGTPFSLPGGTVKLAVESMDLTFTPYAMNSTCTLASPVVVPDLAVGLPAPTAGTAQLLCDAVGTRFYYPAATTVSASRVTGTTTTDVSVAMASMPGIVPLTLTDVPVTSELALSVGGSSMTASGSKTVASIPANSSIPVPAATGSMTSSAASLDVQLTGAHFTATAGGSAVDIPCTVAAPFGVTGVSVAAVAPPSVTPPGGTAVTPRATASKTTAKYAKAKKTATIVTTVSASGAMPTGSVSYVVKLGKKKIAVASVALSGGKATLVLKKSKLKKKGKYTVTAAFGASASFGASSAKASFKVK